MHTETSISYFEKTTTIIGRELQSFRDTTRAAFKTVELPGETAARAHHGARKKAAADPSAPPPPLSNAKGKFLNLLTYKFHVLGDYVKTICFFGTADSYSTQIVCRLFFLLFHGKCQFLYFQGELAHRFIKRLYGWTNKNNATKQMTKLEHRDTRIRRAKQAATSPRNRNGSLAFSENNGSLYAGLDLHHYMSKLRKDPIHLLKFVQVNPHNPTKKGFIPKLKDHLLSRLLNCDFDSDQAEYSPEQPNTVQIIQQTMFPVQTLHVNFTTYDM
ncbi:hypothetical protein B0H10DRAFT_1828623 [Mycena sp. CBHHK59/15]|nr:hypothetical protein B0H10DRAFT_1828623 [Mycena sp. CBHHK59/15]